MMKKYIVARKDLLAERDTHTAEEQRTRYANNASYVYEPFQNETLAIRRLKDDGQF